ncbi:MAG: ABC transporter ATP-binding protein [Dehalococcoidia bacterium]|nr:ABC transporter ATP-binding protein [Dehalococcoidia bacterium]
MNRPPIAPAAPNGLPPAALPDDAVLSARTLSRDFRAGAELVHAVRPLDVDIFPGEFVALLGRSGSGKTTLLNLLGGLDTPSGGTVYFQGHDLGKLSQRETAALRQSKLGFIFQSFGLLPLLSAYENVELPMRIAGVSRGERDRAVRAAIELVGLGHRMRHRPYEMSGGEQQRVAIARAIVRRPPLILADEPTAELDSATARGIFTLLVEIVDRERISIVVATHDRLVLDAAHRVLELKDGALAAEAAGPKATPAGEASAWGRPAPRPS